MPQSNEMKESQNLKTIELKNETKQTKINKYKNQRRKRLKNKLALVAPPSL